MTDTKTTLQAVISQTIAADLNPIRNFLFSNPSEPLIATGSGGAETAGEFAALLYGARGGVATSVSPYTLNSYSDEALKTAKVLLVSKGGHNNDIVFATKRSLSVNPKRTAAINFSESDRNEARKVFLKAGSDKSFVVPMKDVHDGFSPPAPHCPTSPSSPKSSSPEWTWRSTGPFLRTPSPSVSTMEPHSHRKTSNPFAVTLSSTEAGAVR